MLRHVVIEFGGYLLDQRQATARHRRKVVVLVVIAHVEGDPVQRAVVRVRFVSLREHVVLADKVSGHRVQTHRQHGAHNQVDHYAPAEEVNDNRVEDQLDDCVDDLVLVWRLRIDDEWPEDVEEGLQTHPEELAQRGAEKFRLQVGGQVRVDHLVALISMVFQVVLLKGHGHRQADGEIAEVAKVPVGCGASVSEGLHMRDLVDGQRQRVVDDAPEAVGHEKDDGPGLILHHEQHYELEEDHATGHPLEVGIVAEELLDLRILFQDHVPATRVGLFRVHPLKVGPGDFLAHGERSAGTRELQILKRSKRAID